MNIFVWIIPVSFFVLVVWIMVRKEVASFRRDESVVDPLFRNQSGLNRNEHDMLLKSRTPRPPQ